MKTSQNNM